MAKKLFLDALEAALAAERLRQAGEAGKVDGMDRVDAAANEAWKAAAANAVMATARELPQLTTDDVLMRINPNVWTHEMRALGPVMLRAAKAGWISKASVQPINCATRPDNHSRPLTVWQSLLFGGGVTAQGDAT